MIEVAEAEVFLEILAAGSLRRAARTRGVDATTLGRLIDRLEARLGLQLLHRTTRELRSTAAGELFAEKARVLLDHARGLEDALTELARTPRGRLRLSLCTGYARARLLEPLAAWAARQPSLQLELRLEDHPVDLAADGVDLAVRVVPVTSPDLIVTRLERYAHVLVASPRWLAQHGAPSHPSELAACACLAMRTDRAWTRWRFRQGRDDVEANVQPIAQVNDTAALLALAEAGAGVTVLPSYLADDLVRRRRLVPVLPDWTLPPGAAYVLHARRRRLPAAARDCLAALQQAVAATANG